MTGALSTTRNDYATLPDLCFALAEILDVTPSTAEVSVNVDDDGTVALTRGDALLRLPPESGGALRLLAEAGALASKALAAVRARAQEVDRDTRTRTREAAAVRYGTGGPDVFGLVPAPGAPEGTWTLPDPQGPHRGVTVTRTEPVSGWHPVPVAATLAVHAAGGCVGHVHVSVDEDVTLAGAHHHLRVSELDRYVGWARFRDLTDVSPWRTLDLPNVTRPAEAVAALASVAHLVTDWVRQVDDLLVEAETVKADRARQATEWARLSRSKDRIPTRELKAWMANASHIDYAANGLAIGGWQVVSASVVGATRPHHLDAKRRGDKAVGVAEVLYVARLFHTSPRDHRQGRLDNLRFRDTDLTTLRAALPACVVKMPEDGSALFVAYDKPEYLEALDAAMVEWVLLGPQ